jgi:hypothetical protein
MSATDDWTETLVERGRERAGYLTTAQLLDAGVSRRDIAKYHSAGILQQVVRGLHVVPDAAARAAFVDRVGQAVARAGPGAVVARETAARLRGIAGAPAIGPITLTIPSSRSAPRLPGVDVKRADIPADDITEQDGLRVTSALRTVVDCARYSDRLTAVCLIESAARQEQAPLATVTERIDAMRSVPGVKAARAALSLVDVRSESPLETAVRLPLLDAGLVYPELQFPFDYGRVRGRIDLAYPVELLGGSRGRYVGLAIEADGRDAHERDDETFHHDRIRQTALEENGWLVRRFTDRQARQATEYLVAVTRRAIAQVLAG